jgi:perosamine synthetase
MLSPQIRPRSIINQKAKTSGFWGKNPASKQRTAQSLIPYGRQWIDEEDIQAVVEVLRSDWLTTGPKVEEFEEAFAQYVGAKFAVAVSSGTAALHAAMHTLNIRPGDEVIVPPMTFAATANSVVYHGGTPVFADVDPATLLIDPEQVEKKISPRTKAIVGVDYAGQPCNWDALGVIARNRSIMLVADSCHALGAAYKGKKVGSLADLTVFSFHPVKHITTGEGGMITTEDPEFATRLRAFRNHGINSDHRQREKKGSWYYEMIDLGFNYRLTEFQSALGLTQLRKLPEWLARRRAIARCYDSALAELPHLESLAVQRDVRHAYHLYVVKIDPDGLGKSRADLFRELRLEGIGVNVHYIPVHLHPYYRRTFNTGPGLCPKAESAYGRILSLPVFPKMERQDVNRVIWALTKITKGEEIN